MATCLKPAILLLWFVALNACVVSTNPAPVPSCAPKQGASGPTDGALEILASDVPELVLDSMHWSVNKREGTFVLPEIYLYMGGRITSAREVPLWGIGVLFEGQRDSEIVFRRFVNDFTLFRPIPGLEHNAATLVGLHRVLPNRPAPVWLAETNIGDGVPLAWGCPARARLARDMELARHIGLVARVARDTARELARRRAEHGRVEPIEILIDTLLDKYPRQQLLVGVAVNTTSRTIHDAAVWVAVNRLEVSGGPDTLSFPLGDVAPHALVSFGGGDVSRTDSRPARGIWLDGQSGPRVTALHNHSVNAYRRANNGQVTPSVLGGDEYPGSQFYPWNPASFDLDSVLATRRPVYAILHGPSATSERTELVIVFSKVLYRRRSAGRVYADSSRASWPEMSLVFTATRELERVHSAAPPMTRPTSPQDAAIREIQPGAGEDVLVFQPAGGSVRRLKFSAGQPPAEARALFNALMRIERRSATRAREATPG